MVSLAQSPRTLSSSRVAPHKDRKVQPPLLREGRSIRMGPGPPHHKNASAYLGMLSEVGGDFPDCVVTRNAMVSGFAGTSLKCLSVQWMAHKVVSRHLATGISSICSTNWMVLYRLTRISMPHGRKVKSFLRNVVSDEVT